MYTKKNAPALLDALESPLFMSRLLYYFIENFASAELDDHPVEVRQVGPFKAAINYRNGMATVSACVEAPHISDVLFRVYVADTPEAAKANGMLQHNAPLKAQEIAADWGGYCGLNGGADPRINNGLPTILVVNDFPSPDLKGYFDEFVERNGIYPVLAEEIQGCPLDYLLGPSWFEEEDAPDCERDFSYFTA